MVFNVTFNNIFFLSWGFSFIGGRNRSIWRKPPTFLTMVRCLTSLKGQVDIKEQIRVNVLWSEVTNLNHLKNNIDDQSCLNVM
jgi:hypothetical protein